MPAARYRRLFEDHEAADDLASELEAHPRRLEALLTLFSGSPFLGDLILREPERVSERLDPQFVAQPQTQKDLRERVTLRVARAQADPHEDQQEGLRRALLDAQRRELLRIGVGDLTSQLDLRRVTEQLSWLAEALIDEALLQVRTTTGPLTVLAFGKLGGGELNYSSDIDLVFVSEDEPTQYWADTQSLISVLSKSGLGGFLYRVDTRLRPWGREGPLVVTRKRYLEYLKKNATPSEKQALLKVGVVGGDPELGERFLEEMRPLIVPTQQEDPRAQIAALKTQIEQRLDRRGSLTGELKSGPRLHPRHRVRHPGFAAHPPA